MLNRGGKRGGLATCVLAIRGWRGDSNEHRPYAEWDPPNGLPRQLTIWPWGDFPLREPPYVEFYPVKKERIR